MLCMPCMLRLCRATTRGGGERLRAGRARQERQPEAGAFLSMLDKRSVTRVTGRRASPAGPAGPASHVVHAILAEQLELLGAVSGDGGGGGAGG